MHLALLFLATTAGQAVPATPPAMPHHRGMFVSPMGEPFRASSRDADALADWFAKADRDHDGRLTLEEMQQDADRFFAALDADHDGEIGPDEISHYETEIAPGGYAPRLDMTDASGPENGQSGGRGHGHRGGAGFLRRDDNDPHQGAGRFGLLDLPEPVIAADTNFNRGVSAPEFRQAAAQRFMALDLDHHGYLTLAGLETIRPAPPSAPKAPPRPPENDSALPDGG